MLEELLVLHQPGGEVSQSQNQNKWLNEELHQGLLHLIPGLGDASLCDHAALGYGVW